MGLPAAEDDGEDVADDPSEAELVGAATAGSAREAGSGECDMVARLQSALRKDVLVRAAAAAAARAPGQAMWVWNGDWVRRRDQEGKGLAAVREAIMWEVAFAPAPCRTAAVRGLVLISLDSPSGGLRLVMGARDWRWSDLLGHRPPPPR